jgi:hypothetical protein
VRINDTPEERQIPSKPLNGGESGGGGGGSVASVTEAEILYEGLLRRKKEDHGRFEDPYKMVCVCRLQVCLCLPSLSVCPVCVRCGCRQGPPPLSPLSSLLPFFSPSHLSLSFSLTLSFSVSL